MEINEIISLFAISIIGILFLAIKPKKDIRMLVIEDKIKLLPIGLSLLALVSLF